MVSWRFVIRPRTAIVVGLVSAVSVAACSGPDQSEGIVDTDRPETVSTTPTSVGERVTAAEIEVVEVPPLVGLLATHAEAVLDEVGLNTAGDTAPDPGMVVDSDPSAGAEVALGSSVDLDVVRDAEPTSTCGPLWFPSDTRDPTPDERSALEEALQHHPDLELFEVLAEPWEWQVQFVGGSTMNFHGRIGDRNAYLVLTLDPLSGAWIWSTGTPVAECEMSPLEAYEFRANVYLAVDHLPAPEDTELVVFFQEPRCSGAEGPIIEGRYVQPVAIETDTAILVTVWTEGDRGNLACGGFPRQPATVTLSQPVGERTILDMGPSPTGPAVPIETIDDGWITTPADLEAIGFKVPNGDQHVITPPTKWG